MTPSVGRGGVDFFWNNPLKEIHVCSVSMFLFLASNNYNVNANQNLILYYSHCNRVHVYCKYYTFRKREVQFQHESKVLVHKETLQSYITVSTFIEL